MTCPLGGADCGLTFNPLKTQVVFFTRRHTIPPRALTVSGHPVPYSLSAQYLGLMLDRCLWWHEHVLTKTTKAKRLLNALLSATRGNWGPRPDVTKWIFTASVSYAAIVWAHDTSLQKTNRCLTALDRLALKSITHSARSCPTRGLAVVLDLLPLPLFLRRAALCGDGKPLASVTQPPSA